MLPDDGRSISQNLASFNPNLGGGWGGGCGGSLNKSETVKAITLAFFNIQ